MKSLKKLSKKINKQLDPLAGDMSFLFKEDGWKLVKFELQKKDKTLTIRVSDMLLKAVKEKAKEMGVDYQKLVRIALEQMLEKKAI